MRGAAFGNCFQAHRFQLSWQRPEAALVWGNSTRIAKLDSEQMFPVLLPQNERTGRAGACPGLRLFVQLVTCKELEGEDSALSYKDFGQCIGPCAGYVTFGWVESYIVNRFFKLLPMGRELLDACLTF